MHESETAGVRARYLGWAPHALISAALLMTLALTPVSESFAAAACEPESSRFTGDGTNGADGVNYRVFIFSDVGTCEWQAPSGVDEVDVLIVGGGGGGGGGPWAGGGGGGGVLHGEGISIPKGMTTIPIVVGAGGTPGANAAGSARLGANGGNSAFNGVIAPGGGGGAGAGWNNPDFDGRGRSGGSGGGSGEHGDSTLRDGDLVYRIEDPSRNDESGAIEYFQDQSGDLAGKEINRITYRMEVVVGGERRHAEVAFDAWNTGLGAGDLRVPDLAGSGFAVQEVVKNMVIDSNMPAGNGSSGVTTSGVAGTLFTGYLEFWPWNYDNLRSDGSDDDGDAYPPGGDTLYDFNDSPAVDTGGYGAFQVHNVTQQGAEQTVFAWNEHGNNSPEIGFGNYTGANPDWTFSTTGSLNDTLYTSDDNWSLEIRVNQDQFRTLSGATSTITAPLGWAAYGHAGGDVSAVATQAGSGGGGAGGDGGEVPRTSFQTIDGVDLPRKAGDGGAGAAFAITGSSLTYAGGGGGGTRASSELTACSSGGVGGGGAGSCGNNPVAGTDGLGGGGGGAHEAAGARGGSGVVVVRYVEPLPVPSTSTVSLAVLVLLLMAVGLLTAYRRKVLG